MYFVNKYISEEHKLVYAELDGKGPSNFSRRSTGVIPLGELSTTTVLNAFPM